MTSGSRPSAVDSETAGVLNQSEISLAQAALTSLQGISKYGALRTAKDR